MYLANKLKNLGSYLYVFTNDGRREGNVSPVPTRHQSNTSAFLSFLCNLHRSFVKKYYSPFKDEETGCQVSVTWQEGALLMDSKVHPLSMTSRGLVISLPLSFDKLYLLDIFSNVWFPLLCLIMVCHANAVLCVMVCEARLWQTP